MCAILQSPAAAAAMRELASQEKNSINKQVHKERPDRRKDVQRSRYHSPENNLIYLSSNSTAVDLIQAVTSGGRSHQRTY